MEESTQKLKTLAIQIQQVFPAFYLAGGTNLMFKYNHRISTDLDFFSEKSFSFARLTDKVLKKFPVERYERKEDNIDFWLNNIKVSFVFFPFKNAEKLQKFFQIKMASDIDIFLNKLYVSGRRIDNKDIFDIAFLYEKYQYQKDYVKALFEKKFPFQSFEIFLGAVFSLEDYPGLNTQTKKTILKMQKNWMLI